jgi:hypothetical protein
MPGTNLDGQPLGRQEATRRLNQDTRLEEKLDLRIGAQVMLIMVRLILAMVFAEIVEHEGTPGGLLG